MGFSVGIRAVRLSVMRKGATAYLGIYRGLEKL
jgi:hypothetical protein